MIHPCVSVIRILSFAFAASLVGFTGGCEQEEQGESPQAIRVETAEVRAETLRKTVEGIGTFRAKKQVEIRPEIGGRILERRFEEGGQVEQDQILFVLDDEKLQRERDANVAALEAARARLNNAEWELERIKDLYEEKAASPEEFKQARDTHDEALAEVDRLEAEIELVAERIEDKRVHAPFTGRISQTRVDPGDFVEAGEPLAVLYSVSPLELEFSIPETHLGDVAIGMPVAVTVTALPDREFEGRVTYISPSVDEATRDFRVKADVENGEGLLKPGGFGRAEVTVETRENRPVIPEESLVSIREGYVVFVVRDGKARRRSVKIGLRRPGRVEIRSGLEPGEMVVRQGHMRLADGDPVEIVGEKASSTPSPRPLPPNRDAQPEGNAGGS